jgi:GDPmannose 4,6-dehydratase
MSRTDPVRALITGVTGQDGWYLSEVLAERGYDVFGLVSSDDTGTVPPYVTAMSGDLRDRDAIRAALDETAPDEVYNLAAVSSVAQSWREPELVADVNGVGTVRLLAALQGRDVRFVQASSAEIFGTAAPPQDESTPIAPTTPYGASKAFAHLAVGAYREAGLHASSVILFNHESPRRPDTFVTRKITKAVAGFARGSREPLHLGSLDVRRDWGYARDYAMAMTLVARHEEPTDFVIATGRSHTIADFVATAFACVGIDDWRAHVVIDEELARQGDSHEQRGDAAKAGKLLGWTPTVEFEELVRLMVDNDIRELQR